MLLSGRDTGGDLSHPRLWLLLLLLELLSRGAHLLHASVLTIGTDIVGNGCRIDATLTMDHAVSARDGDLVVLLHAGRLARCLAGGLALKLRHSLLSGSTSGARLAGPELTPGLPWLRADGLVLLWLAGGKGPAGAGALLGSLG